MAAHRSTAIASCSPAWSRTPQRTNYHGCPDGRGCARGRDSRPQESGLVDGGSRTFPRRSAWPRAGPLRYHQSIPSTPVVLIPQSWAGRHSERRRRCGRVRQDALGAAPSGTGAGPTAAARHRHHAGARRRNRWTRLRQRQRSPTGAIREAVNDAEVTYTLGFYPDANSLDDKFHELESARLKHSGYEVRSPRGYFALKDSPVSDAQHQNAVAEAILSPLESSQIHVDATLERGTDSLAVAGSSIDLHDLQLSDAFAGAVEVSIVQQDAAGKILGQTRNRYNLALTKESYAAHLKSGVVFREKLAPKEGLATLRVLVSDLSDERVGSLIIPYSQVEMNVARAASRSSCQVEIHLDFPGLISEKPETDSRLSRPRGPRHIATTSSRSPRWLPILCPLRPICLARRARDNAPDGAEFLRLADRTARLVLQHLPSALS